VITAVNARNGAVELEWIASPVQDLKAFHVYRSDGENDPPVFLGCKVIGVAAQLPNRWPGMRPSCGDIPATPDPTTAHGTFRDATVEPNRVYWYRVSALDWLGNESECHDLRRLPAISTFTYCSDLPATPAISAPGAQPGSGCGLAVAWGPAFDAAVLAGFVVFRASAKMGPYRQISPIVAGNSFEDRSARREVDYWYQVQAIDKTGKLSQPSPPVRQRY
jgi:hypothetical protein